jgi:hypothetical protein
LQFDYTLLNEVMRLVKKHQLIVLSNEQGLFCEMKLGIPIGKETNVCEEFSLLQGLEFKKTTSF